MPKKEDKGPGRGKGKSKGKSKDKSKVDNLDEEPIARLCCVHHAKRTEHVQNWWQRWGQNQNHNLNSQMVK